VTDRNGSLKGIDDEKIEQDGLWGLQPLTSPLVAPGDKGFRRGFEGEPFLFQGTSQ
jgi:hypothetical protein